MICAGVTLWVWGTDWGGDDPSAADLAAYAAAGVHSVAVKVSEGTRATPAAWNRVAPEIRSHGMVPAAWNYDAGGVSGGLQAAALVGAAPDAAAYILDVEDNGADSLNCVLGILSRRPSAEVYVCAWGDPTEVQRDIPYAQLDRYITAWMPQTYVGAWQQSNAAGLDRTSREYTALGLHKPLLPVTDRSDVVSFAQTAAARGLLGVGAWRHGANGITPQSIAGAARYFTEVPMPPPHISGPYAALVETHTGLGYYVLAEDGGVETHGDATPFPLNGKSGASVSAHGLIVAGDRAVSIALTPSGRGYVIFSRGGGVYTFGDAAFEGAETG